MKRAAFLLSVVLLSSGCASDPIKRGTVAKDRQGWVGSWDELIRDPAFSGGVGLDLPAMTHAVYVGEFLAIHLVSLRPDDVLQKPLEPAHEALIVVEGKGTIDLGGAKPEPLESGTIGLLPKGTRGTIRSHTDGPLLGLLIRRVKPRRTASATAAKGGPGAVQAPRLFTSDEVLPLRLTHSTRPFDVHTIGSIGGGMTLNAVSVRGKVRRHVHLEHDEFVFLLSGAGDFGMGTEGGEGSGKQSKRSWQPNKIRERAMCFIPFRSPHEFQNRAKRTLALSVFGPDAQTPMRDRFFVPDKPEAKAPETSVSRQLPPGELPPPKKR